MRSHPRCWLARIFIFVAGGNIAENQPMPNPPRAAPVPPVERVPTQQNAAQTAAQTPVQIPPVSTTVPLAKVRVAILLPLSGKNAPLGQAMLNAAQQAEFDVASSNFELMPRDTGAGEEQAAMAARDAIANGAQLLIGPLFTTNIPAVHDIAANANVSILTLSTDTSRAAPGVM